MQQIFIAPKNLPCIEIYPAFKEQFTPIDLLRAKGEIVCLFQFSQPSKGEIFTVIDQEFHLIAQVLNCELILQRNHKLQSR